MARQRKPSLDSNCCVLEGNIFTLYLLQQIFQRKDSWQTEGDYAIPKGSSLEDESQRSCKITYSEWQSFRHTCLQVGLSTQNRLQATQYFVKQFLTFGLGYNLQEVAPIFVPYFDRQKPSPEDRTYPITLLANNIPVAIVSEEYELDERCAIVNSPSGALRKSAFQMVQELINGCSGYQWGLVSNGKCIRLVHRLMSLTSRHYLEFNLQTMFSQDGDPYAEFLRMWLVMHASRTKPQKDSAGQSIWDLWFQDGINFGEPARRALSNNLEQALQLLGEGFLNSRDSKHVANEELLHKLQTQKLSVKDYQHQLLQLIYRFFFVFCLEERNIIHVLKKDDPENDLAIKRYNEGYAFHRFIQQSNKQRFRNHYHDAFISVVRVFKALDQGEERLALPALGGLFQEDRCPDLMTAKLENRYFFAAMEKMRWAELNGYLNLIDYKNMDTEELGSIYEGLLELIPQIREVNNSYSFSFLNAIGNERKLTGSYYTPDSLVQSLLKTALDPVIEQKLKDNPTQQEQALLSLSVIDPACGSGHFLLAAARRIAEKLADIRAGNEHASQLQYRKALHDVVKHCIYGVDLNPMAVELTKIALWLEGFAEGTPLSFLDHHIKVGNALLGVFDVEVVKQGIPDEAYAVTSKKDVPAELNPTDKTICNRLKKNNKAVLNEHPDDGSVLALFKGVAAIDRSPEFSQATEQEKEQLYQRYQQDQQQDPELIACDLYMAAFLSDKKSDTEVYVPTSSLIFKQLYEPEFLSASDLETIRRARELCAQNSVFHWPFAFPEQFNPKLTKDNNGFDCVLGNPPWDKVAIEDDQFFVDKNVLIAHATPASKRKDMIKALASGTFAEKYAPELQTADSAQQEQDLYYSYVFNKHISVTNTNFCHLTKEQGGRFHLTGTGRTNIAYYFAELAYKLHKQQGGTAGVILPAGIITDSNTQAFSHEVFDKGQIGSAYHFENTESIFKAVDGRYSFILLTLQQAEQADFVFYATNVAQLDNPKRHVHFATSDFPLLNPSTHTCVLLRSDDDLNLCRKLYQQTPVLYKEEQNEVHNPWNIQTLRMFAMDLDSGLFHDKQEGTSMVPLYEGKMIHQFEHRWVTFDPTWPKNEHFRDVTQKEKENSDFVSNPRYWVESSEVKKKLKTKQWLKPWMLVWRNIARATDERTLIATVLPASMAIGEKAPQLLPNVSEEQAACLLAMMNSLVVDYVLRSKQPGASVLIFILKQLPILPPDAFKQHDIDFICSRVAKLTRNAVDINAVWLTNYPSYTYQKAEERLQLRAELDAYIARMYGLNREELQYILDPKAVKGEDHPSVTFPTLKSNQEKEFEEYLTQRLVLQAFDDLEAGRLRE